MIKARNGINRHELYRKAFYDVLHNCLDDNGHEDLRPHIKKLVYYGVRAVNSKKQPDIITQEEAELDFQFGEVVKSLIGSLTPAEFMNLFPITKDYDGHRWRMKDYFYTINYIDGLELDKPIGTEIEYFLWEYLNHDISMFNVHLMMCLSNLRRLDGQKGLMEAFCDQHGIKTYAMHTDHKGKKFLFDKETGKTLSVRSSRPKHLKIVRSCKCK